MGAKIGFCHSANIVFGRGSSAVVSDGSMTFRQERLLRLSLQIIAGQEPRRGLLVSQGVTASNVVRTPSHRSTQAVGNQDEVQLLCFLLTMESRARETRLRDDLRSCFAKTIKVERAGSRRRRDVVPARLAIRRSCGHYGATEFSVGSTDKRVQSS